MSKNLEIIKGKLKKISESGSTASVLDGAGNLVVEGLLINHNSYYSIGGRTLTPDRVKHVNLHQYFIYIKPKA